MLDARIKRALCLTFNGHIKHTVIVLLIMLMTVGALPACGIVVTLAQSSAKPPPGRAARGGPMRRVSWHRLSTKVVIMQVAILVVTLAAGFWVVQWNLKRQLDQQFEHRALAVAESLASQPATADAVVHGRPGGRIQTLAEAAMDRTGALFVVVTNAQGIRYAHPKPWLIGTLITYHDPEPRYTEPFRTGKSYMGVQTGTLGPVAAGKAPLWYHGRLSGEVSVGFPAASVSDAMSGAVRSFASYLLAVLAVAVLAALAFARRLKRQTFGLELKEIAALLQERE